MIGDRTIETGLPLVVFGSPKEVLNKKGEQ
jgi:hypothetical protein